MIRFLLAALLAAAFPQAGAQLPPALAEVQRTAPHLVVLAGSPANFQNLVMGLMQGGPVTLTTPFQDGTAEVASFTPVVPLGPNDVVMALERARIALAGLNILQPTAGQLGAALAGGAVDTATARSQMPGVLPQAGVAPGVRTQRFFIGVPPGAPPTPVPGSLPAPPPGAPVAGMPNSPAFPSQTPGFPSAGGSLAPQTPPQAPAPIVSPLPGPVVTPVPPAGAAPPPAR